MADYEAAILVLQVVIELDAKPGLALFAFDLLEPNGQDLRREPLETRKATLASLLREHGAVLAPIAQPVEHRHAIAVAGYRSGSSSPSKVGARCVSSARRSRCRIREGLPGPNMSIRSTVGMTPPARTSTSVA